MRRSRGINHRAVHEAERKRVNALLERDRAYEAAERLRKAAEVEIAEERFVNLSDTVTGPTPEQLTKGEFRKFTPRQPDKTARTVTAYRRKDLPQVQRLILSGTIDATGFRDCIWYRNLYESTGLSGSIGSVDYGREVFVAPHSRAMFADRQVEAQDTFRFVRANIRTVFLHLLDQVVLEDIPIYKAQRAVGAGWRSARRMFGAAVDDLHSARDFVERPA